MAEYQCFGLKIINIIDKNKVRWKNIFDRYNNCQPWTNNWMNYVSVLGFETSAEVYWLSVLLPANLLSAWSTKISLIPLLIIIK